jgi:hypothetical protein
MTDANERAEMPQSEPSVEQLALAGAAAVERLIADRDRLRNAAGVREREMGALRAMNEDLRRRLLILRQHYVEVATKVLGELERLDKATREAIGDVRTAAAPQRSEDSNLISIAERLAPANGPGRSANAP